jgi:hypothetical protein
LSAGIGSDRLSTAVLAAESIGELAATGRRFDLVLSDFGVLNCAVDDQPPGRIDVDSPRTGRPPALDAVLVGMAAVLPPGGRALLGVMGPTVPWEWLWFLAHRDPARATRRLRRTPRWRDSPLQYPRAATLQAAAADHGLVAVRVDALGALVPPPFAEGWARRHPATLARLERAERRWSTSRLLVAAADHYLVELVRR